MTKYLLLYRSPVSAADQMSGATPEQAQAGMDAWTVWGGKAGRGHHGHGLAHPDRGDRR